jgi:hypothetical protein
MQHLELIRVTRTSFRTYFPDPLLYEQVSQVSEAL